MRRIVIFLIFAGVITFAAVMLLRRPKGGSSTPRRRSAQTDTVATARTPARGRTVGRLKPLTREERAKERKRLREEARRRKRELRRQERERRRMLRASRRGKSKKSRKGTYYVLKAVVSLGSESYALIDNRRVRVGDVVMGRKVVAIHPDRIEIEVFGRKSIVRVGESLLPTSYFTQRKRRI